MIGVGRRRAVLTHVEIECSLQSRGSRYVGRGAYQAAADLGAAFATAADNNGSGGVRVRVVLNCCRRADERYLAIEAGQLFHGEMLVYCRVCREGGACLVAEVQTELNGSGVD